MGTERPASEGCTSSPDWVSFKHLEQHFGTLFTRSSLTASLSNMQGDLKGQIPTDLNEVSGALHLSSPKSATEDDARSEHSDSWEVISRGAPTELVSEALDPSEIPDAAPSEAGSEGHDSADTFIYSITAEDIHSDADTHRTDDLLRHGEVEYQAEPALIPEVCTSTDEEDEPKRTALSEKDEAKVEATAEHHGLVDIIKPPAVAAVTCLASAAHATSNGAGRLVATLADHLRVLAAKVRAFVANYQPAAQHIVGLMACTVQELARSLQFRVAPGIQALSIPLSGASVVAADVAEAMCQATHRAFIRARKGVDEISAKDVDWVKVGLVVGCAGVLGMLWKVNAANARLTARLVQRESELAELVSL